MYTGEGGGAGVTAGSDGAGQIPQGLLYTHAQTVTSGEQTARITVEAEKLGRILIVEEMFMWPGDNILLVPNNCHNVNSFASNIDWSKTLVTNETLIGHFVPR